jgi:putative DNA primase/helicase
LASLTIEALKLQKRWVLWRLEKRDGKDTKVPYRSSGAHASSNDPSTWATYAEVSEHAHRFSGIGVVFGEVDGIQLSGVDLDNCCDAVTGKFTPESKEIVIGLDSYSEYSPSGTGCHVLVLGTLKGRKGLKLPFQGIKAVELYDQDRYFTFTGRGLPKAPKEIIERMEALNALYDQVRASKPVTAGVTVAITVSEEERLRLLMDGDTSLYDGDRSKADFALCCLLAKKHDCNGFKVAAEFEKSGLLRDKWIERDDYRENTITKACKSVAREVPVLFDDDGLAEDRELEYLVSSWFPKGEVSLIGAPSGAGKTSFGLNLLEALRNGREVWGHPAKARDYRVLSHDRSKRSMVSTVRSLGLPVEEVLPRVIRLTTKQQLANPADVFGACLSMNPGVEVWFIEGLDLWIHDMNKMDVVAPIMDGLQRLATLHDVAVIATVGSPKQKGKEKYTGRDALFGSAALARKAETIVTVGWTDDDDPNSVRKVVVMPRTGQSETLFFTWLNGRFDLTREPQAVLNVGTDANRRLTKAIAARFSDGSPVKYLEQFGPERTFYVWQKWAAANGLIRKMKNRWFLQAVAVSEFMETQTLHTADNILAS